jgi:uncharacterized ion transporter superfamily protein YfcC
VHAGTAVDSNAILLDESLVSKLPTDKLFFIAFVSHQVKMNMNIAERQRQKILLKLFFIDFSLLIYSTVGCETFISEQSRLFPTLNIVVPKSQNNL